MRALYLFIAIALSACTTAPEPIPALTPNDTADLVFCLTWQVTTAQINGEDVTLMYCLEYARSEGPGLVAPVERDGEIWA